MERVVSIKITSDGRAFVVDQAANADAAAKFGRQVEEAGKQTETAGKKIAAVGKDVKEAGDALKKAGDSAGSTGDQFKKSGDGAGAATPKMRQLGDSAQRTAQQMRQVAPQITDIVTQLAAGQSPMQIFIQQGGQLKDVFGGVGPAARAVGGYVLGMVNPLTITVGLVGGLAAGFVLGSEESAKFSRQLLLSGNAAGATAGDYHQMAAGLAAIAGTKGAALDAIGEMAQSGRVAADDLQRFTGIAQQLDRLVGKPVADTAKEFAALSESPVAASLKLTQTYNYLTASVYQQIKALQDQGRETEAAKLAQDAFAQAFEERIPKMQASLGVLSRAWLEVKDAISKTGDSLLNIGRAPTLQEQIAQVRQQISQAQGNDPNRRFSTPWDTSLSVLQQQLAVLEEQERSERRAAAAAADRLVTVQARGRFDKMAEDSLSKQEKLARAIAKAEADGAAAGATRAEIDKVIANERKKHVDSEAEAAHQDALSARVARVKRAIELEALTVKEGVQQIAAEYKLGLKSYVEYVEEIGAAETRLLQHQRAAIVQEIAIATQKKNSRQEVANLEGQLLIKDEEIAARRKKIYTDVANRQAEMARKARESYRAEMEQWERDQGQEQVAADKRYEALQLSVSDYVRALGDESDALGFQVSLMGRSSAAQERLIELHRIDIGLREKLRDIDRQAAGGNISADRADLERSRAREAAAKAAAEVETRVWLKEWNYVNDQVGSGLYAALTGRGEDARRKLGAMFEDLVLRPTIMGILQPVTGAAANFLTGGSPAGGSGVLGGIGNAASAYNGLSGIGSSFMAGYSGSVALGSGGVGATFGVVDTAAVGLSSATGGGLMAGIQTAMASIPVAGWIALGAVVLSSLLGDRGGPKANGYASTDGTLAGALRQEGGNFTPELDNAAKAAISTIVGGYTSATAALGVAAGDLQAVVRMGTDPEGDSKSHLLTYATLGGQLVYDRNNLTSGDNSANNALFEDVGRSPEEMQAAITLASSRAILAALQATDMPEKLATYFDKLDPLQLNADQISAAITAATNAQGVWKAFGALGDAFSYVNAMTVETTSHLIEAGGGMQVLSANLATYYDNFYSAEEKRRNTATNISSTLASSGVALTADELLGMSRGQFREMVEQFAELGPEGERAYLALIGVSGAFASITEGADLAANATETLDQALTRLRNPLRSIEDIAGNIIRLESDTDTLRVQLLRAQGSGGLADALQRSIDTAGLTAAEIAIYDYNAALRLQIGAIEDANTRIDDAVAELARARETEADSLQTQLDALTGSSSALRRFALDLRAFRDSLMLGQLSPLTPGERLAEAGRQFESTYAAALGGDENALARLQGVSQEFLEASQLYNASSTAYLADFARVQTALTLTATAADSQAESAEEQIALLRSQLTALESLGQNSVSGTLTVAGAIENLRLAVLAAQGLGVTVGGGILDQAGLPQSPVNPAYNSAATQIRALYSSAIGVSQPDTQGLDFWTQRLLSGVSIAQLTLEMQESAKFVRGYATGGLASGLSLVGERGPEVVDFSTPGRVYTAQQTAGMFGSNDALLDEVRGLRQEVRSLREQVRAGAGAQIDALMATSEQNAQRTGELVGNAINRGAFERRNAREAALA